MAIYNMAFKQDANICGNDQFKKKIYLPNEGMIDQKLM